MQVVEPVSCNLICLVTIGYIVQVVEPGVQLLVYSQLKIVEGFLAIMKFGGAVLIERRYWNLLWLVKDKRKGRIAEQLSLNEMDSPEI